MLPFVVSALDVRHRIHITQICIVQDLENSTAVKVSSVYSISGATHGHPIKSCQGNKFAGHWGGIE